MATFTTVSATFNSVPAPKQQTLTSNYIDFTADGNGWAQQYLPDLMEKEAEVFGNRSVGGFLEMVGAEEAMTSDQVVWSEQGRLHLSYKGNCARVGSTAVYNFSVIQDIDGNALTGASAAAAAANLAVRVGDLVIIADADATVRGYVTAIVTPTQVSSSGVFLCDFTVAALTDDGTGIGTVTRSNSDVTCTMMVFGSGFAKGTNGRAGQNQPSFKSFTNRPIILKDKYAVSGSDASAIGWVEVSGEDGQAGYMWYLKAAGDTRQRFADYLEMSMIEGELVSTNAATVVDADANAFSGTEGLFAAITARGHLYDGLNSTSGTAAAEQLEDFDSILAKFDEQGAIEEYMLFLNRSVSLKIDDMLAGMNSYGAGGTSYGVFNNEEDMALNLGFSGFRRGSYDFYKTDWKYLNDKGTRGGLADVDNHVRGVFIPAGVTSVYDQNLVTQGANNFILLKGTE